MGMSYTKDHTSAEFPIAYPRVFSHCRCYVFFL